MTSLFYIFYNMTSLFLQHLHLLQHDVILFYYIFYNMMSLFLQHDVTFSITHFTIATFGMSFIWTVSNKFQSESKPNDFTNIITEIIKLESKIKVAVCNILLSKPAEETEDIAIYSNITKGNKLSPIILLYEA